MEQSTCLSYLKPLWCCRIAFTWLLILIAQIGFAQSAFVEQNGALLIQMESGAINSKWKKGTEGSVTFYEGLSNSFSNPLNGIITYQVKISKTGIYRFEWRNKINFGNLSTEHNDSWLRFPNTSDVVFFGYRGTSGDVAAALANKSGIVFPKGSGLEGSGTTPNGAGSNGFFKIYINRLNEWVWFTRTSDRDPHEIFVKFNKPGTYTFEIGQRSQGHAIDKMALYHIDTYGVNINKSILDSWPESPRDGTVTNQPPSVNAGSDKAVTLPTSSVVMSGTASDADGVASTTWSQISGPNTATLSGANTLNLTASNLVQGVYTFRLTATDTKGLSNSDDVKVTVNAVASSELSVVSFTLINTTTNQPVAGFNPIPNGASINLSQTGNQLSIRANTNPATVGSVVLNLVGSNGGVSYDRTESAAPYALFGDSNGNFAAWMPAAPQPGYTYSLTGTPFTQSGGKGTAGSALTLNFSFTSQSGGTNQPPTANAGSDKVITLPTNSVVLNGSGSDADGSISAYLWTQVSGPSAATLSNANTANLTASALVQGTYTFKLEVTDNQGAKATDQANVVVNPAPSSGGSTDFWLEAECALVGSNWQVITDNTVSNGAYLLPAGGNNTSSPSSDPSYYVTFDINVAEAGEYKLFALVNFPSSNDDSFWVRANGGSWTMWNGALGTGNDFAWRQVHVNQNRSNLLSLSLMAGANTVQIARREDGAALDKVFITKTGSLPAGLGGTAIGCSSNLRESSGDLSVNSQLIRQFEAYPNPASGLLSIEAEVGERQAADLEIISLTGQTVYQTSFEGRYAGQLPIASYAKGIYLVRIKTAQSIFQKKVLFE